MTYVGASESSHHRSIPTWARRTTCPRTGVTEGSAARCRLPSPAQSTTTSAPPDPVRGRAARLCRVIVPPSSATRAASQSRWTGISTTGAVNDHASAYPAGRSDPCATPCTRSGTAGAHHGSGPGRRSTSVPGTISTPVCGRCESRSSSTSVVEAQAVTRSCGSAR